MASEHYESAKQTALSGFQDPGPHHLNCAQTVVRCAMLALGQDPKLTGVANYLGGGMARMGEVCGALSGSSVSLGLKDYLESGGEAGMSPEVFAWLQKLTRDFETQFGSATCKGLLGHDISTAEGFREAKKCQAMKECPNFVAWCCDRLAEQLDTVSQGR